MNARWSASFGCLLLAAGACGDPVQAPGPATTKAHDVYTVGDIFSPAYLDIAANDTVRWHFAPGSDNDGHDVSFNPSAAGRPANIPVQKTGSAFRVFPAKGVFRYDCFVHPGMFGEITVK
jgi:plastocyanin